MTGNKVVLAPSTELVIPDPPAAPTSTILATRPVIDVAAVAERKSLSYAVFLTPEQLALAKQEAVENLVRLLGDANTEANPMGLVTLGANTTKDLDRLSYELLELSGSVRISELEERLTRFHDKMRQINSGYNIEVPEIRAKFEKMAGRKGWIRTKILGAKTMLEMFFEDIRPFQEDVKKLNKELSKEQIGLLEYVGGYDRVRVETEKAIEALIFKIVMMEDFMLVQAKETLASLPPAPPAGTPDPNRDQRGNLSHFITSLERKIAHFKGIEILAEQSAPRILDQRAVTVDLAMNLQEVIDAALPLMTRIQFNMAGLMVAKRASDQRDAVTGLVNDLIVMDAQAGAQILPEIATKNGQPLIWATSIKEVADAAELRAEGMIQALASSRKVREDVVAQIVDSRERMNLADDKLTDAVIADALIPTATLGAVVES